MKKLSTLLLLLMLFTAPFVFTSCNEPTDDEYLAMLVEGGWDGTMDISYTKNDVKYPSTGTHVQFWNYSNSTTSGYGKWCNKFGNTAPIQNLTYDFLGRRRIRLSTSISKRTTTNMLKKVT